MAWRRSSLLVHRRLVRIPGRAAQHGASADEQGDADDERGEHDEADQDVREIAGVIHGDRVQGLAELAGGPGPAAVLRQQALQQVASPVRGEVRDRDDDDQDHDDGDDLAQCRSDGPRRVVSRLGTPVQDDQSYLKPG